MKNEAKKKGSLSGMDYVYLAGMIIPIVVGIALKVLFIPAAEGIEISGAHIFFKIPLPLGGLPITEAQVNSWLVMTAIFFLCKFLTNGLSIKDVSARQHLAEWIVEQTEKLVKDNMGEYFAGFAPFIGAILGLSAFSSFVTLVGLFPPTSDINITAGWAILVFILITYYKMKFGPWRYLKGFTEPIAFMAPINVVSEAATPVSMAMRHYGNVLSGTVISALLAAALQGASALVFGWLPGVLGEIPFLQIGIPAVLSIYFDLFSGGLQAFIFAMLTMIYISNSFSPDEYKLYKESKQKKKLKKQTNS